MLKAKFLMASAGSKKSKASSKGPRRKWVRPVRFDFDSHGLRSAYVPVQDASTKDASMLIAAAIQQAWANPAGAEDED